MNAHNRRQDFIFFSAPLNQTFSLFAYEITPVLEAAAFMKLQHQVPDVFSGHSTVNPAGPQAYVGTLPPRSYFTSNTIKFDLLLSLSSAILSEFSYKGARLESDPLQQQLITLGVAHKGFPHPLSLILVKQMQQLIYRGRITLSSVIKLCC